MATQNDSAVEGGHVAVAVSANARVRQNEEAADPKSGNSSLASEIQELTEVLRLRHEEELVENGEGVGYLATVSTLVFGFAVTSFVSVTGKPCEYVREAHLLVPPPVPTLNTLGMPVGWTFID